jgi:hypothetical protein
MKPGHLVQHITTITEMCTEVGSTLVLRVGASLTTFTELTTVMLPD